MKTPFPASLSPLPRCHGMFSFTLIELMAATSVLSIVLLMMIGMQDQMSRAWTNANRRNDATREARTALSMMARDLPCMVVRPATNSSRFAMLASKATNSPIPFFYTFAGSNKVLLITNVMSNSSQLFAVIAQKASSPNSNNYDLALVGYYVGMQTNRTNVSGFATTNYNLYRYYVPPVQALSNLTKWLALSNPNTSLTNLFSDVNSNSEILAQNVGSLRIQYYGNSNSINQGLNEGANYFYPTTNSGFYGGNKLGIELCVYPEDFALRLTPQQWINSNNIQKYTRAFEFRVDVPKQ